MGIYAPGEVARVSGLWPVPVTRAGMLEDASSIYSGARGRRPYKVKQGMKLELALWRWAETGEITNICQPTFEVSRFEAPWTPSSSVTMGYYGPTGLGPSSSKTP